MSPEPSNGFTPPSAPASELPEAERRRLRSTTMATDRISTVSGQNGRVVIEVQRRERADVSLDEFLAPEQLVVEVDDYGWYVYASTSGRPDPDTGRFTDLIHVTTLGRQRVRGGLR